MGHTCAKAQAMAFCSSLSRGRSTATQSACIGSSSEWKITPSLTDSMIACAPPSCAGPPGRFPGAPVPGAPAASRTTSILTFFSADRQVCTALVYRAYEGLLRFELVKIMGRNTLPALEICRKFASELGTERQELEFVLFLDAVPQQGTARLMISSLRLIACAGSTSNSTLLASRVAISGKTCRSSYPLRWGIGRGLRGPGET
jgi:hypothetical protein